MSHKKKSDSMYSILSAEGKEIGYASCMKQRFGGDTELYKLVISHTVYWAVGQDNILAYPNIENGEVKWVEMAVDKQNMLIIPLRMGKNNKMGVYAQVFEGLANLMQDKMEA